MTENLTNLAKHINVQVQEGEQTPKQNKAWKIHTKTHY